MKIRLLLSMFAVALMGSTAFAQHAGDVEIGYEGGALVFEADESTVEGFGFFEAEFEDVFGDLQADEPGFDTDPSKPITTGHQIWLNLLDAGAESTIGAGFINFYSPGNGIVSGVGDFEISSESSSPVSDLIFDDGVHTSGSFTQFIDQANAEGDAHGHLIFDLTEDTAAPIGAYGMLFELESYFGGFDGSTPPDLISDKFWIVLNNGLTEEEFEGAEIAFGVSAIPEPGSIAFLLLGATAFGVRRRRN